MQLKCKYCGAEFTGEYGTIACPDCASKIKKSVIRIRTCQICGREFPGMPASKYCPQCSEDRKRERSAQHRKNGARRPLGSIDQCAVCGKDYVVTGGIQKYCPDCAHEAIRQKDRIKSKAWNAENIDPEQRNADRHAARAQIPCRVCGRLFVPSHTAVTCSPQCAAEYRRTTKSAYDKANKDAFNQRKRKQAQEKIAAMTPEEYRAYRATVNARARENYRKKKENAK